MKFRSSKFKWTAAAVGALVLIAAGATAAVSAGGGRSSRQGPTGPISYVPTSPTLSAQSAMSAPAALSSSPGIGALVANASLGPAPATTGGDIAPAHQNAQWLYGTVKVSGSDDAEALWKADLAQGALAEEMAGPTTTDLADVVSGSQITEVAPDGSTDTEQLTAGAIAPGQVFSAGTESDATIVSNVDAVLASYNLTPKSVTVLRPLDAAVAVIVSTADPDSAVKEADQIRNALLGNPYQYEGLYLEIDDSTGASVLEAATDYRTGEGRLRISPQYESETDMTTGGYFNPLTASPDPSPGN